MLVTAKRSEIPSNTVVLRMTQDSGLDTHLKGLVKLFGKFGVAVGGVQPSTDF